jgi:hypothetical protein
MCNGSASQNWLYSTSDKSVRSLGKCMEIAEAPRAASRWLSSQVWIWLREYLLQIDGRLYDSKTIAGVAHR